MITQRGLNVRGPYRRIEIPFYCAALSCTGNRKRSNDLTWINSAFTTSIQSDAALAAQFP